VVKNPEPSSSTGFTNHHARLTVGAFLLGWRPHSLDTVYMPSTAGVGVQVGTSDPVFMHQQPNGSLAPRTGERPTFPLDLDAFRARLAAGDQQACEAFALGVGWLQEINVQLGHVPHLG